MGTNDVANTGACTSIAVGIVHLRAAHVFRIILEKKRRLGDDAVGVGTGEPRRTGCHSFGALSLLTHHQDGFAERRTLFLNAAGIGEQHVSAPHQVDERHVGQGLDQFDRRAPA
jgi:hypothetical protein